MWPWETTGLPKLPCSLIVYHPRGGANITTETCVLLKEMAQAFILKDSKDENLALDQSESPVSPYINKCLDRVIYLSLTGNRFE